MAGSHKGGLAMISRLIDIDTKLFLFLNGLNHPALDQLMWIISAKLTWVPLYALILLLLIWHFRVRSIAFIIAAILLVALTDLSSVHLFKNIFLRLRPCHEPALEGLVHIVNGKCGGMYGFVSSHAANTFGFATLFAMVFRDKIKWLGPALLGWAAIVSYSRIYLGVHYPGDILGGALLGMALAWIVWRLAISITRLFP